MAKRKRKGAGARAAAALAFACHKCYARAGAACVDYTGRPKGPCVGRDKPDVAAAKYERKAADLNRRKLAELGGDNTLLTYLHGGADGLLAAEGVRKVGAADVVRAKLAAHRAGVAAGGGRAQAQLDYGFNWITARALRRTAAGLLGAAAEADLWAHALRVYGPQKLDYVFGFYRRCLTRGDRVELEFVRHEEPAPVTAFNRAGVKWRLECTKAFGPVAPVLTDAEFERRFAARGLASAGAHVADTGDDPAGLFEATIGVLVRKGAARGEA